MKSTLFKFALIALTIGGINISQAAPRAAKLARDDAEFLEKAAELNAAEIKAGNVAQTKGVSDHVKSMGAKLVKDHTESQIELNKLAGAKGAELPAEPAKSDTEQIERLEKAPAERFDKGFLEYQTKSHKTALDLFEKAAKGSKDAEIKAFAAKQLPVLKAHHEMLMKEPPAGTAKGARGR